MTGLIVVLVVAFLLYAVVAAGSSRRPRPKARRGSLDRQLVAERWAGIEAMSQSPGGYKQAISEADKLLDYALKNSGFWGNTLAERLKRAERKLSDHNAVWRAHKLRNSLAHEVGFEVTAGYAQEAIAAFKRALQDLGGAMKVVLYMAISLNGMVATGQGETPWGEASWKHYVDYVNDFGNMIVGGRTYEGMLDGNDFEVFRGSPKIVVVTQTPSEPTDKATFVTSPELALKALSSQEKILVGGGPGLATSMIEADQIDEIHLDIEPVLLGNGLPLLSKELDRKLKFLEVIPYDGGLTVKYSIMKGRL